MSTPSFHIPIVSLGFRLLIHRERGKATRAPEVEEVLGDATGVGTCYWDIVRRERRGGALARTNDCVRHVYAYSV